MRANKNSSALVAFCVTLVIAMGLAVQSVGDVAGDINDLLNLDQPTAKKEEAKPVEAAKPVEEEKKQEAEQAPAAEEKPAEETKPVVAEEKPAEEAKPAVAEEKSAEEAPAAVAKEEKPAEEEKPAAEEAKPAEEAPAAVVKEEKSEEEAKPVEAVAEAKPAEETPAAVAKEEKPAESKAEPTEDEKLVAEVMATETLVRESLKLQAEKELKAAREAMAARDWEEAYKQYRLAYRHLSDNADQAEFKRECWTGMGEAKYQAGKQMLKENNRELAAEYAKEALKFRHPRAGALLDSLEAENKMEIETDISDIKHRRNDEDYKKSRDVVRQRIRLASQYLAVADLNSALEQVDLVLRTDPYNEEAIQLRARIQRKRDMIIDKEREATRRGMIADVGAAWRPVYAVNSAELKSIDGGTTRTPVGGDDGRSSEQSIEKRMKEMMLPSISFRPPATIIDAVDFFRQASKDFDRPEIPVDQRGFNFVLQLDKVLTAGGASDAKEEKDNGGAAFSAAADDDNASAGSDDVPVIPNVNAANVSLFEALKLVCQVCKPQYKFKVQGSVIMVMPKTMTTDEMVTRTYSVIESFVDRMNDASSGLKNEKAGDFGGGGGDEGGGSDEDQWKAYFADLGVNWPQNSKIKYIKAVGKLRVTNTEDQLAILEDALNELNVTPSMIEIETRFVEVAQEDLNSLGFEWLLNSDYSFNVGGKLKKVLNLKDGAFKDVTTETTSQHLAVDGNGNIIGQTTTTSTTAGQWARNWIDPVTQTLEDGTEVTTPGYYAKTRKNVGVNAIDGSTYQTGMRYLSTEGNHISGEGSSGNDKFMRVNAFLGNADLSMILHMLSQRSDTDLLSAPKVVTKSGQEATIKVVTIYRYPQDYDVTIQSTSSGSSSSVSGSSTGGSDGKILPMVEPQNFETQEVGVILTVTPELSPEGFINLALQPKVISEPTWKDYGMKVPMSSVMSSTAQTLAMASGNDDMQWFTVPMEQPFFKERSIDTHVTLYNGSTIVMGGLITEERKSMEDKIPFLGDVPFIGRFFRSRSEWSNKRNMLLFVTARLVDPNGRQIVQNASSDVAEKKDAAVTPAPEAAK